MKRIILYTVIICLCFLSCRKNGEQKTDTGTTLMEERVSLLPSMVLSRIDRKDTIYNYEAHISYPTVLKTRDTLDIKPIYSVWQEELEAFVDSVTYIYNHRLNKKTSYLSFELISAYDKDGFICCEFYKKMFLATGKDTVKAEVFVVYDPKTKDYGIKTTPDK